MNVNSVQATIIVAVISAIALIIATVIGKDPAPEPLPCDKMEKLLVEGNNFLKSEDINQQDFETWRNKCEGILIKSSPDIKEKLAKIEDSHLAFDFYSQTGAINRLLESEIVKCK